MAECCKNSAQCLPLRLGIGRLHISWLHILDFLSIPEKFKNFSMHSETTVALISQYDCRGRESDEKGDEMITDVPADDWGKESRRALEDLSYDTSIELLQALRMRTIFLIKRSW